MIENKLTYSEIKKLLTSILDVTENNNVYDTFSDVFGTPIANRKDLWEYQRKYLVTYRGLDLRYNTINTEKSKTIFHFEFKIRKLWCHLFNNPLNKPFNELKNILLSEIGDMKLASIPHSIDLGNNWMKPNIHSGRCYFDSNAYFTDSFKFAIAKSPITIFIIENKLERYLQFSFHSYCYQRVNGKSYLKSNWFEIIEKDEFSFD